MKKLLILLLFLPIVCDAQEAKSRLTELGVNINGPDFGVRFKTGNQANILRLTLLPISGSIFNFKVKNGDETKTNSNGLGFNIGFERRKNLVENLSIYFGSDLLTSFEKNRNEVQPILEIDRMTTYSVGIGLILGFNYNIIDKLSLSAEFMPSIKYFHSKNTREYNSYTHEYEITEWDYGLSSNGVNLTLSFRIGK